MEKNRRKAFWGLQIKYTMMPLLCFYGVVMLVMNVLFLFNYFVYVKGDGIISFAEQVSVLPASVMFFVLLLGTQVILATGFFRQNRNKMAMQRIFLPEETKGLIRLVYSFFATVAGYLICFLILCELHLLDNLLMPETAFGGTEFYLAYFKSVIMVQFYCPLFADCLLKVPVVLLAYTIMAPGVIIMQEWKDIGEVYYILLLMYATIIFSFASTNLQFYGSLIFMVSIEIFVISKYIIAYGRRKKNG